MCCEPESTGVQLSHQHTDRCIVRASFRPSLIFVSCSLGDSTLRSPVPPTSISTLVPHSPPPRAVILRRSHSDQSVALAKKPHVVIATPGRLVDHLENTKGFSLRTAKFLVLDEADRMLSMVRSQRLEHRMVGRSRVSNFVLGIHST